MATPSTAAPPTAKKSFGATGSSVNISFDKTRRRRKSPDHSPRLVHSDGGGSTRGSSRQSWQIHRRLWSASRRALLTFAASAATVFRKETDVMIPASHFETLGVLGEGTFGKIYLVRKTPPTGAAAAGTATPGGAAAPGAAAAADELYAMKVLKRRRKGCLKDEMKILASVCHPFVVSCKHVVDVDGGVSIVMDYAENGTVQQLLQAAHGRRVDERAATRAAAELASALMHLHSVGIVHRDIKPSNTLVDGGGHCLLSDFGLAAVCDTSATPQLQRFCGTVDYCAPELLRGERYGVAVDWWAFGCVVYELLCGCTPFHAPKVRDLFASILSKDPSFATMPRASRRFVAQLLEKDAARRLGATRAHDDVCNHYYFHEVDWQKVGRRECDAPFAAYVAAAPSRSRRQPPAIAAAPVALPPPPPAEDAPGLFVKPVYSTTPLRGRASPTQEPSVAGAPGQRAPRRAAGVDHDIDTASSSSGSSFSGSSSEEEDAPTPRRFAPPAGPPLDARLSSAAADAKAMAAGSYLGEFKHTPRLSPRTPVYSTARFRLWRPAEPKVSVDTHASSPGAKARSRSPRPRLWQSGWAPCGDDLGAVRES
ncbi:kinase-like domain-containing protein [Pelagophyceae sp. CCMP2097]|nr:kinase-like domain-containing protein [Pelagophyceae sp. CCMP2097]